MLRLFYVDGEYKCWYYIAWEVRACMQKVLRFSTQCISCIFNKYISAVPDGTDEKTKLLYAKGILRIIADAGNEVSAPEIVARVTALKNCTFGFSDDYKELKTHFNKLMLGFFEPFSRCVSAAQDPLLAAVRFAMCGNYIDFGAMDSVDEKILESIPRDAEKIEIDTNEYENFAADLKNAKNLVYLTDNCGEIVMDRILLREIKRQYPNLDITVILRGEAVLNDATIYDAEATGLAEEFNCIGNGTNIAGTCLDLVPENILKIINGADIIISKGQGNFETLHGCALNVYYLFLCKCSLFAEKFKVPKLTGMFLNDKRM